jgi:3'-phosphoadenosine 5'-phosphosulfate sulfotransferase (PAPS reductase)/FAD synthetase
MKDKEYVLTLSYGKDSLACLGAIEELGLPLDRIVHVEVWATDTIHADLPEMVEFKAKADKIIKERYGIEVEHIRAKHSYEDIFYRQVGEKGAKKRQERKEKLESQGKSYNDSALIYGFPRTLGAWCNSKLKVDLLNTIKGVQYVGIALDEPVRLARLGKDKISPLAEAGWTEEMCRKWCEDNDLLSPIYTTATRGGCWFCHNSRIDQLRLLRKNHPDLWAILLKWDIDSPVSFKPDGHTVHDFDKRFEAEEKGLVPMDRKFRWRMLD